MPFLFAIPLMLLASTPTEEATVQKKDKPEIVVTGNKRELRYILKDMLAVSADTKQIGRFERKICPKVIGYPADYSAILERLIRGNATNAGSELASDDCRPNAVLIFIDEPQRLVSELADAVPGYFGHKTEKQRDALPANYAPIYSWRVVDIRSYEGQELQGTENITGRLAGGSAMNDANTAKVVRWAKATRLGENTRQDILLSMAVVDITKTEGKSLRQLADLATMHLLLDLDSNAPTAAPADSILRLFDDGLDGVSAPARMSVMDRAMISGLYSIRDNALTEAAQRGRIADKIKESVETKE